MISHRCVVCGYKSFSKSCQSQYSRQPVILNDDELEYINERDRNEKIKSYDEIVNYKNPNTGKKYNYICPRFWCLRDENGKSRSLFELLKISKNLLAIIKL